jgi:hypothetical protein
VDWQVTWRERYGNWILMPPRPRAIAHFLGGAFVAAAPQVTYRSLLEHLAEQGYLVIATPFINTFNHTEMAQRSLHRFNLALEQIYEDVPAWRSLPIYGIGHSMGCKLHLLIGSLYPQERAGNVLISFNNYPAKRSIPLLEQASQFSQLASQFASQVANQFANQFPPQLASQLTEQFATPDFDVEFTPSPEATFDLITRQYQVQRNLLVKFRNDDLDQTRSLTNILGDRFPESVTLERLNGNHLTPLGQDVKWRAGGEFSPLDAIGQFIKQEVNRDFNGLKRVVEGWLES